jgi:hypothetical protein
MGLLCLLIGGVWMLALRVSDWERRLDSFEYKLGYRWSYLMERDAWQFVKSNNPDFKIPDVKSIRAEMLDMGAR